jgi:hypothetical protein
MKFKITPVVGILEDKREIPINPVCQDKEEGGDPPPRQPNCADWWAD